MKKSLRLLSLVLAVLMALSLTSCGSKLTIDDIKANGKLTMATNALFEPFEYYEGGSIVGIDPFIAGKIADEIGVELEIVDMEFDSVVASVKTGKSSFGAAGMSITEARKKSVSFSDPYFSASQVIIVLEGSSIKGPDDITDKKLGVQLGTTGDTYCTEELTGAEVIRYDNGASAVQALIAGKIDAVIIDDFPATKYVERNPNKIVKLDETLTVEEYAICVNKNNKELLDTINKVLAELKASGELDTLIGMYMEVE